MNARVGSDIAPVTPAGRASPFVIVLGVLVALLAISAMVRWYAREVLLPRYCSDPRQAVARLERIIVEPRPAPEGESRTPYLVAAKLVFLVPRASDEPLELYLKRVEAHIRERCGGEPSPRERGSPG